MLVIPPADLLLSDTSSTHSHTCMRTYVLPNLLNGSSPSKPSNHWCPSSFVFTVPARTYAQFGNLLANVAHSHASTSRLFVANSQLCLSIVPLLAGHLPIQCMPLSGWRYFFLPFLTSNPHPLSIPSVTRCLAPCSCCYPLTPLLFLLAVLCSQPYHHISYLPHISCFCTIALCFMLV